VDEAVWRGDGELGFRRSVGTSVVSIIVVGMGVSLGREAAPKLMGAAFGSLVGRWALIAPLVATLVLGVIGIWLPQLFGNGKGIAHDAFLGAVARRVEGYSIYSARLSAAPSTISP